MTDMKIGRIGYVLKSEPGCLTFQDFDQVVVDLNAGEVRFERLGNRSGLTLNSVQSLSLHLNGQGTAWLVKP